MIGKTLLNIREKNPGMISWIPEDDDNTDGSNIHHQDFEDLHQTLSGGMSFNIHNNNNNNNNNTPKNPGLYYSFFMFIDLIYSIVYKIKLNIKYCEVY